MIYCTSCGSQLQPGIRFCTICGTPVAPEHSAADAAPTHETALDAPTETVPADQWAPSPASPLSSPEQEGTFRPPDFSGASPTGTVTVSQPPRGPAWGPPTSPPPQVPDSRRLIGLITGLVLLAVLVAGGAVLLSRHNKRPSTPAATSSSSPTTPSPTNPGPLTTTPPATPTAVTNIAGEASIAAPPAAPNGHDASGNPTSYGTDHLTDGSPSTAWRMVGDGSSSDIVLTFSAPRTITRVGMINGYAKTDPFTGEDRYRQNRRITAVTWTFEDGATVPQQLSAANRGMQSMALPQPEKTRSVRLQIEAVTGFTGRFDYSAISEIQLVGS